MDENRKKAYAMISQKIASSANTIATLNEETEPDFINYDQINIGNLNSNY